MIQESFNLDATNNDILAAPSRLAAMPYAGTLILEFQAGENTPTNHYVITLQLPDGTTPIDGQLVVDGVTAGALNADDKYVVAVPATKGGHVLLSAIETGTTTLMIRATLTP